MLPYQLILRARLTAKKEIDGGTSPIGPKQTSLVAPHMSAFGGKADMAYSSANVCFSPKATSGNGANARIYIGLSIVVNRPGRHAATRQTVYEGVGARAGLKLAKRRSDVYQLPISKSRSPISRAN
jgi:hypothetical protein